MRAKDAYVRYRRWAGQIDQATVAGIALVAAMVAVTIVSLAGPDGRQLLLWGVLPWLTLLGGAAAAFDVWGAAAVRGNASEGAVRAAIILILTWGFSAVAFLR